MDAFQILPAVKPLLPNDIQQTDEEIIEIINLVKDRCTLLTDFAEMTSYFFRMPVQYDLVFIESKWNENKQIFFAKLLRAFELLPLWKHDDLEITFKEMAAAHQIKSGELLPVLRIMLVGGKFGPGLFDIARILGREETMKRIKHVLQLLPGNA